MQTINRTVPEEGIGRAVAGTLLGIVVFIATYLGAWLLLGILSLVPGIGEWVSSLTRYDEFNLGRLTVSSLVTYGLTYLATWWGLASTKALSRRVNSKHVARAFLGVVSLLILLNIPVLFSLGDMQGVSVPYVIIRTIAQMIAWIAGVSNGYEEYERENRPGGQTVSQKINPHANVASAQQIAASTGGTHCPSCHYLLSEGASFCGICGASVEPNQGSPGQTGAKATADSASSCPSCNQAIRSGDKFCPGCGTKITTPQSDTNSSKE